MSDTNVGIGMAYDSHEERYISQLEGQVSRYRKNNQELQSELSALRKVEEAARPTLKITYDMTITVDNLRALNSAIQALDELRKKK